MKPTIYMNEDNEHFYHCHPAEDMSVEGLRALVDRYVDTGCIKGILFCTNVQRALFDSDVWERFRDIRDQLPTPYPAHLQLLSERGIDHFKVWLERAAERGVEGWLTMRMNDSHGLKETAIGDTSCVCYAWATEYWKQHPELRRAPYRYERDWEGGYDYAKKEVREYHLAFVRELFERYDMYGLECDWMRWATMFAPGHEREGQKHLNEFVKDVRALADEAEKRYGHRIRLAHRVPFHIMTAYNAGFDVPEWYRMGAVDMLTLSNFGGMACYDPQIKLWRQLLPECQINMAVEAYSSPYPQIGGPGQDPAFRRGCAACAWYAGADSLYLFNHCYSETKEMDKLAGWMQEISDPELVKNRSRRMIPSYSFRIAGETQGTSLPVPLIEPAPGHDTGRMEATITVRLNAGEFDPAEKAFIKIGFDAQTDVEQLLDMPVWFNTVPLRGPVKEDMSDPENRKKYTNATASVLIYPLPQGCLKEEFNAVEILPPAIPGDLVWAELYFSGDDQ